MPLSLHTGWSDVPHQESQSKMFGSFLRKAGRYHGVIASDGNLKGQKEIILVEVITAIDHCEMYLEMEKCGM